MKLTIRKGVWETNSSSMHSIAVMKDDEEYTKEEIMEEVYINKNGVLDFWDDERLDFGRYPFRILTSFIDKFKYAAASIGDYWHGSYKEVSDRIEALIDLVNDILPEVKDIKWPKHYEDAYRDQEGNELSYDDLKYDYNFSETHNHCMYYYERDGKKYPAVRDDNYEYELNYYGQVDHQSADLLNNFLKKEGITLKEFLTKKKYIVIIDGDEYCSWIRYKDAKIINTSNIDHEFRYLS